MSIDLEAATRDGVLTIDGVAMQRRAWAVTDVTPLWLGPDQRGEDLLIPGRPGKLSNPRRADSTNRVLRMVIDGTYDHNGNVWTCGYREGIRRNLLYLRQNVSDPTNTGDGTRLLRLTTPDHSSTLTARVTVGPIRQGDQAGPFWRATLDLTIPAGALT